MALSNRDRIQRGLELLRAGLSPFVERELRARLGEDWIEEVNRNRRFKIETNGDGEVSWDTQALLSVMWDEWNTVFRTTLAQPQRTLVS